MKKLVFIMLIEAVFAFGLHAQKISITKGKFDFLTGQKTLLVTYDYSNVAVGKFDKEEDYIAEKVAEYNKSEEGRGDTWKEAWLSDRPERFEPKFEQLFNENIESKDIILGQDYDNAEYEVVVKTTFVEPGYNIAIMRKSASINVEMSFINRATGEELAVIDVKNCPGRDALGFDFDTGYRIEEAYAMLGKSVARYLLRRF